MKPGKPRGKSADWSLGRGIGGWRASPRGCALRNVKHMSLRVRKTLLAQESVWNGKIEMRQSEKMSLSPPLLKN